MWRLMVSLDRRVVFFHSVLVINLEIENLIQDQWPETKRQSNWNKNPFQLPLTKFVCGFRTGFKSHIVFKTQNCKLFLDFRGKSRDWLTGAQLNRVTIVWSIQRHYYSPPPPGGGHSVNFCMEVCHWDFRDPDPVQLYCATLVRTELSEVRTRKTERNILPVRSRACESW